jgi:hypothetical protein
MKRTKILALVLAVSVMLMGAGYAAWSDQLFLDTTVRTGNFDMQITKATTRTGDDQARNESHNWHSYDWTHSGPVTFNANEATVEFVDLYPGGVVQVDMTTKNMGTIPAKLKSIEVQFLGGNGDLFNRLQAQTSWKADINGDNTQDDYEHVEQWKYWRNIPEALNKLVESTNNNNIVIEPKGWMSFGDGTEEGCIQFKLDPNAGNEFQNQSCRFKIVFNWEQWATDPNANPYDGDNGYGGDGDLQ